MQELLGELGFSASFWRSESEFCSLVELRNRIDQSSWERKEAILIVKLLCWLEETETGLLSELKLYGEEREEISYFRMQIGEENRYHKTLQEQLTEVDCVIYDLQKSLGSMTSRTPQRTNAPTLILKDIPLLEEAMRRSLSIHISMDDLIATLEQYRDTTDIVSALRWIESLYISFPDRPTGPNVSPPGDYGETYFLPQSEIWHRGHQTLSLTSQSLTDAYTLWRDSRLTRSRQDTIRYAKIDTALQTLNRFHTISCDDGVIITIIKNTLRLSYIPREVHGNIRDLL